MTVAFVQSGNAGGSFPLTVTMPSNTTAGNCLIAGIGLPTGYGIGSVTDTAGNRWIQIAYASSNGGNAEIWSSRGIQGGATSVLFTVASVSASAYAYDDPIDTYDSVNNYDGAGSVAASVGAVVAEFSGLDYRAPLDQWTQWYGVSASPIAQSVTPRASNDLFIAVVAGGTAVTKASNDYTTLTMPYANYGMVYKIATTNTPSAAEWTMTSGPWAVAEAAFLAGGAGSNSRPQFPEVEVQIQTTTDFLAPINGQGVFTSITGYVRNMTLGPQGRQHELDRISAAPAQITVNNRGGEFASWNINSFLYNGGAGLRPQNVVKVTAAWAGTTYSCYYGYLQSLTPVIADSLNQDVTLNTIDVFQTLSLKYLANNNYEVAVLAEMT